MAYRLDRRRFLQTTGAGALALGVGLPLLAACGDDGGPDIAVEPIVQQGKAEWAYTGSEFMAGASGQGAKLKVIGTLFQNNPFGIMSMTAKAIKTPQDMLGKKIGVQAVNEGIWDAL